MNLLLIAQRRSLGKDDYLSKLDYPQTVYILMWNRKIGLLWSVFYNQNLSDFIFFVYAKNRGQSWLPAYSFYNFHGKLIFMHLFGGCFDIFPSRIVVVEQCYTITILASLFILYSFSILATLLTTSFCAVFVGFFIYGHLGLAGCRIKEGQ